MTALVVFSRDNEHPLAHLLNREVRHVWCITYAEDKDAWTSFNWRDGRPLMRAEANHPSWTPFALAEYYRSLGNEVFIVEAPEHQRLSPFILNNCVGLTKLVLGIRSWALTPNQLRNYILRCFNIQEASVPSFNLNLTLPGFGGSSPPEAPPPTAPPPTKVNAAQSEARKQGRKQATNRAGIGGATRNTGGGLGVPTAGATTANKVLLG